MAKTIDLMSRNTRLTNRFGKLVIPDGETYIHVDGVRKLKLDKTSKCSYDHGIPDTPQFKGLNGETDVTVSYAPHTYYLELPPGYHVMPGGTTVHYPSCGICTGGSPTTIQMGAYLYVGFSFGVDMVPGSQTELCGADVWSEDGVSIPTTCESGIIDPCKGVVCDPECDDSFNKYETACKDGICIKGTLIDANSVGCGYIPPTPPPTPPPPDDEPDDEIYDEVHGDVPPGSLCVGLDLYQLIEGGLTGDLIEANSPLCITAPPEDEGIFGGILMWVIIAVIALTIIGLLT